MTVYLICYLISFLSARNGLYGLSGLSLMAAAVWLYLADYRKSGSPIHLRGLFSLAWVGGQGLSCLKLSRLQGDWQAATWICFLAAFAGFWCVFELLDRRMRRAVRRRAVDGGREETSGPSGLGVPEEAVGPEGLDAQARLAGPSGLDASAKSAGKAVRPARPGGISGRGLLLCLAGVTAVSWLAFLFEVWKLRYIPFLVRGVPHAYSEFHVSGVHYFTVSCVLAPALAILYAQATGWKASRGGLLAAACALLSLLLPILCVSRFQMIFAVALAMLAFIAARRQVRWYWVAGAAALVIPLYLVLTVARSHDVAYLNSIFEMRDASTPIFITQPYMYIANNYDNFNCLVEAIGSGAASHTMGLKQMFPLFVFTGLKFRYPRLVSFPLFVTKEELTTVTLFYDAFYDFGLPGVLALSCVLGAASWILTERLFKVRNPIGYLFYGQMALYLMVSFFTTWFTNPTTWFYLIVTGMMYLVCQWMNKRRGQDDCREDEAVNGE